MLVHNALEVNFPLVDLVLALSMHMGIRCLQVLCCLSGEILPNRSILPGCSYAISLTKALFKPPLRKFKKANPHVKQTIYVE